MKKELVKPDEPIRHPFGHATALAPSAAVVLAILRIDRRCYPCFVVSWTVIVNEA